MNHPEMARDPMPKVQNGALEFPAKPCPICGSFMEVFLRRYELNGKMIVERGYLCEGDGYELDIPDHV
jgi:hypothetical protein